MQFVTAKSACTAARMLDASGDREKQAASRIEHQREDEVNWTTSQVLRALVEFRNHQLRMANYENDRLPIQ